MLCFGSPTTNSLPGTSGMSRQSVGSGVVGIGRQVEDDLGLERVGVLELVDEDPLIPLLGASAHLRVVAQQVARPGEQVLERGHAVCAARATPASVKSRSGPSTRDRSPRGGSPGPATRSALTALRRSLMRLQAFVPSGRLRSPAGLRCCPRSPRRAHAAPRAPPPRSVHASQAPGPRLRRLGRPGPVDRARRCCAYWSRSSSSRQPAADVGARRPSPVERTATSQVVGVSRSCCPSSAAASSRRCCWVSPSSRRAGRRRRRGRRARRPRTSRGTAPRTRRPARSRRAARSPGGRPASSGYARSRPPAKAWMVWIAARSISPAAAAAARVVPRRSSRSADRLLQPLAHPVAQLGRRRLGEGDRGQPLHGPPGPSPPGSRSARPGRWSCRSPRRPPRRRSGRGSVSSRSRAAGRLAQRVGGGWPGRRRRRSSDHRLQRRRPCAPRLSHGRSRRRGRSRSSVQFRRCPQSSSPGIGRNAPPPTPSATHCTTLSEALHRAPGRPRPAVR